LSSLSEPARVSFSYLENLLAELLAIDEDITFFLFSVTLWEQFDPLINVLDAWRIVLLTKLSN